MRSSNLKPHMLAACPLANERPEMRKLPSTLRRLLFLISAFCVALPANGQASGLAEPAIVRIWAIDDSEKVRRDDLTHPLAESADNPVWDGSRVSLFGARNEIVAFQLILQAGPSGAKGVDVSLDSLTLSDGSYSINNHAAADPDDPYNYVGKRIELFTEHYLEIPERTDTTITGAWGYSGVQGDYLGWVPDALIPFEAPSGLGGAPFDVEGNANQGVWVDITIPPDAPAGTYEGEAVVSLAGSPVETVPIALQVYDFALPDETHLRNMFFFGPYETYNFVDRFGVQYLSGAPYDAIEARYYQMAHRHRMDLVHNVSLALMASRYEQYLDGGWYTPSNGYEGPGQGVGNRTYSLGTYTSWRAGFPTSGSDHNESSWQSQADEWVTWFESNAPGVEYFLYMPPDEPPPDQYDFVVEHAGWIKSSPGVGKNLTLYCTIGGFPLDSTGEDILPKLKGAFDYWAVGGVQGYLHPPGVDWGGEYGKLEGYVQRFAVERQLNGDKIALYNGTYPFMGSTVIDADATFQRVNPWIAWKYDIDQYFLYHTHYYEYNDPFVDNYVYVASRGGSGEEKKHYGLGTFFYPGTDRMYPESDRQLQGPIASIRMKNWRRGQQDYEYLWLASNAGYDQQVQQIVDQAVPAALSDVWTNPSNWPTHLNPPAPWPTRGYQFEQLRRQLAELIAPSIPTVFEDVPPDHPYFHEIEALYQAGYTAGCNTDPLMYCPDNTMNRAESAVFVERGIHGIDGLPSQPTTQTFADLPLDSWAAKWAEALWQDGYTAGCGTNPLIYCPWQGHTRAEGCVFYLHMLNGPTYEPPQPSQQTFADVPLEAWYAKWVQAAYDVGLLEPCLTSPDLHFCPNDPLSRALAAYMMVQAKGLR